MHYSTEFESLNVKTQFTSEFLVEIYSVNVHVFSIAIEFLTIKDSCALALERMTGEPKIFAMHVEMNTFA